MKSVFFIVSEDTFQKMQNQRGRRVAGRAWLECDGTQPRFHFEPYSRRQSRRDRNQLLVGSEHGWLKKSARRYKLHLSVPDHLGELRAAEIMKREAKAIIDFMRGLDQFLRNV